MPSLIGYVDDSNGTLAHYNMLQTIHDFATKNGWQALRYNTKIENRELILKGTGYSGDDEIYLVFHCYQDAKKDFYNLAVGVALGYVGGNPIDKQPNVIFSGIPGHNRRIDYWLSLNPQRITGVLKVGTPVYENFYAGKFLAYAQPNQYPLPRICAGMLDGTPTTRFSDTRQFMPYCGKSNDYNKYTYMHMWFNDGQWKQPQAWPWINWDITGGTAHLKASNNHYSLNRVILTDDSNIYGELDGIAHISGFDNVVENTISVDGEDWIVCQNVYRTGPNDYFAMRLDK